MQTVEFFSSFPNITNLYLACLKVLRNSHVKNNVQQCNRLTILTSSIIQKLSMLR